MSNENFALYPVLLSHINHYPFKAALEELLDEKHIAYREFKYEAEIPTKIQQEMDEAQYSKQIDHYKQTILMTDAQCEYDHIDPEGLIAMSQAEIYQENIYEALVLKETEDKEKYGVLFDQETEIYQEKLAQFLLDKNDITKTPVYKGIQPLLKEYATRFPKTS